MKMTKCANLHGVGHLRYEALPVPPLKPHEVLVQVKSCGICGSDISRVYSKGTYHFPTVIGHEFSGKVISDPEGTLANKRVVVFPLLPCFSCESCKNGNYATCSDYDYYGSRRNGGMTEYLPVKRWNLLPLPHELSYDEGAMCEPVSVARHAALKLGIKQGDNLLITGSGPIGIIAGQWAKSLGASEIYYVDIDSRKIDFAKTMGFKEYDPSAEIHCAIEGTGHESGLEKCLEALQPFGSLVLMGNPGGEVKMSQNTYWHILRKELKISGTWNSSFNDTVNDWKESLQALAQGKIGINPLITHRYPLSQCNTAFEMMKNKTEFYNKVILQMNREEPCYE